MKYALGNSHEKRAALAFLTELITKKATVEIKRVSERRSLGQNAYLHLLLGIFAYHFGYFPEEAKQIYKELNADIYRYTREVRGVRRTFWKSSADITKEEMTVSIDRLKIASAKQGCVLPDADNHDFIREAQNQLERAHVPMSEEYA